MIEHKVILKEVTSVVWRDVQKAALLAREVSAELAAGWEPQGGVASCKRSRSDASGASQTPSLRPTTHCRTPRP
jgi:hypothetical protein